MSNIVNSLLFRAMAPGYKLFEFYQMSKDTVAYYILYAILPVFKNLLLQSLANSPFYAILFDESMNDHLQKIQMYVQMIYWHDETSRVLTQYLIQYFS